MDAIEDRLDRAERIDPDYDVVETDPIVIELRSGSGNTYTVLPETGYCGCPDHRHREYPCKHLLALALDRDAPDVLNGIHHTVEAKKQRVDELRAELEDVEYYLDVWSEAFERIRDHIAPGSASEDDTGVDQSVIEQAVESAETDHEADAISRIARTVE